MRKLSHQRFRFANAVDERVAQERQAKAVEHATKEEDRPGELKLSRDPDRVKWHILLQEA